MNLARLEYFLEEYGQNPTDPFNLYALGLEYMSVSDPLCLYYFDILLEAHPDYSPVYYHFAAALFQAGQHQKAKDVYEKGLKLLSNSTKPTDRKAYLELQSAYQFFVEETE